MCRQLRMQYLRAPAAAPRQRTVGAPLRNRSGKIQTPVVQLDESLSPCPGQGGAFYSRGEHCTAPLDADEAAAEVCLVIYCAGALT